MTFFFKGDDHQEAICDVSGPDFMMEIGGSDMKTSLLSALYRFGKARHTAFISALRHLRMSDVM